MKKIRVLPVVGYSDEAQKVWRDLQNLGVIEDRKNPEKLLGLTGDGGVLGIERDYCDMEVPIVAFAFGTVNFLHTHNFSSAKDIFDILQRDEWEKCQVFGLWAEIRTKDGIERCVAFNEIYMKIVDLMGYARLKVFVKEFPSGLLVEGDGVMVATPQGSTAYSRKCGGHIIPLDSKDLNLTGIGAGNVNSVIRRQEIVIESFGDEIGLVCDNKPFYGVESVKITPSNRPVNLWFAPGEHFEQRRYNL
ncbi:hypothetical protein ACFL2R_02365 [Patescibacteria group bacterium]